MTFGQRLKLEREKNGFSKVELGKLVNVHYSQIGRYERDKASPSADVLKKMANELNISTDFLMNGTSDDFANEKIVDKILINQFNRLNTLSDENKKVVTKLIDAFIFQQEMKNKLVNV